MTSKIKIQKKHVPPLGPSFFDQKPSSFPARINWVAVAFPSPKMVPRQWREFWGDLRGTCLNVGSIYSHVLVQQKLNQKLAPPEKNELKWQASNKNK